MRGIVYYLIHTVLLTLNLYTNKGLFALNPGVTTLQFTFIRGVCCLLLGLLYGAGNLKKNLIDPIDSKTLPSLVFRCLQGALSVYISFMCIRYFDVSTVSIVISLAPIFVCLLAYFLLGERLKKND
jgi:drug/metabolite transporter (DMT)-like permease